MYQRCAGGMICSFVAILEIPGLLIGKSLFCGACVYSNPRLAESIHLLPGPHAPPWPLPSHVTAIGYMTIETIFISL